MPALHTSSASGAMYTDEAITRYSSASSSLLDVPDLPPRPSSAPPGGLDGNISPLPSPLLQQPTQAMGNLSLQGVPNHAISSPDYGPDPEHILQEDEKTSGRASRFVGNMLIARIGRASWQSLESTARLPFYLSPWGDNLPFTMPNLRRRDLALAGVAHFGLDALGSSAVTVVQHAASATIEQGADESIQKVFGGKGHVVNRRVGMDSLTLRIRHKLIGEAAELVFQGVRPSDDRAACAKGWFCPYLYASGREPEIARANDFAMAQLRTPRLAADASIAPILLSSFYESNAPVVSPFGCPWEDATFCPDVVFPRFRRMAILVAGISPYRWSTTAWSHSRIPSEARISFHVMTHVPAVVLPVRDQSPILAWSPWTVAQMLDTTKKNRYDVNRHIRELLDFVETVIDESAIPKTVEWGWREVIDASLRSMLGAVLSAPYAVRETSRDCCELERMGVVAFRY